MVHNCISWWRHQMEAFSTSLALCAGNSPITGEFPAQRPVTRSFDVFFDLCLNKRLSKQSWGWWFETLSRPLWRYRNDWPRSCLYIKAFVHLLHSQTTVNTITLQLIIFDECGLCICRDDVAHKCYNNLWGFNLNRVTTTSCKKITISHYYCENSTEPNYFKMENLFTKRFYNDKYHMNANNFKCHTCWCIQYIDDAANCTHIYGRELLNQNF